MALTAQLLEGFFQVRTTDQAGEQLSEIHAANGLKTPVAMSFARPGKLWVVERASNELLYLDLKTQQVRRFNPKDKQGETMMIERLACDRHQQLYVAERRSGNIYALDDNLHISAIFSAPENGELVDFKLVDNHLWALDRKHQRVLQYTSSGQLIKRIDLAVKLDFPVSLAINTKGQLFVLDRPRGRVHVFNAQGKPLHQFGQQGYRRGQLNYPSQLMFDWNERLCIVNQGNDRIEVFSH